LRQIEELRRELEKLAAAKGTGDEEVMTASKMLDAMLNEYIALLKRKTGD
jgi:hypothetical protein